ncbi:MAG: MBL fold metallo-hydrolase [candidate division Zixibacteria bacterium]|nr:MBL fold metallo-hydrolase [candidate division Zixibacteria bacterium]
MKFGSFEIIPFVEQKFRLDGGSMFGVIPKKIWGRMISSDDNNLIPMVANLFLLKANGKNILLDTGLGDVITEKERKIYAATGETNIEGGLKKLGITPEDIDYVLFSHLHTDHSGGAMVETANGLKPRFPNATHIVQKDEWEDATNPDERTAAVYIPERLKVIESAGLLELIDGDKELLPGIKAVKTGGHTRGHQAFEAISDDTVAVYYADIIPSEHHIRVPFVPSTDLFPLDTMKVKRELLKRLVAEKMVIAFDHDIEIGLGRVRQEGHKIIVDKVE